MFKNMTTENDVKEIVLERDSGDVSLEHLGSFFEIVIVREQINRIVVDGKFGKYLVEYCFRCKVKQVDIVPRSEIRFVV